MLLVGFNREPVCRLAGHGPIRPTDIYIVRTPSYLHYPLSSTPSILLAPLRLFHPSTSLKKPYTSDIA